jgi:3-methyl-2-oxobutanoate hydroxymethyltransferase
MFERTPKFVRRYADLRTTIAGAVAQYSADVRAVTFPGDAEVYRFKSKG